MARKKRGNAKLLLVDEPAAGMTDEETHRTGELLLSLAGKHTIVVIEHDMVFVRQIAAGRKVTVLHFAVCAVGRRRRQFGDDR